MTEPSPPRKTLGCGGAIAICFVLLFVAVGLLPDEAKNAPQATLKADATKVQKSAAARTAGLTFRDTITTQMQPCDAAAAALATVAGKLGSGASIYDGYAAANSTSAACSTSWQALRKLGAPGDLSGDAADKATETLARCADLAFAKKRAADAMMTVFDGDMRPSAIEEVKSRTSLAESYTMGCAAGMLATALASGVDAKELTGK